MRCHAANAIKLGWGYRGVENGDLGLREPAPASGTRDHATQGPTFLSSLYRYVIKSNDRLCDLA